MEGYDEDQTTQLSTSYTTAFYLLTHHNPPPPPSSLLRLPLQPAVRRGPIPRLAPSISRMINTATVGTEGVQIRRDHGSSRQNIRERLKKNEI